VLNAVKEEGGGLAGVAQGGGRDPPAQFTRNFADGEAHAPSCAIHS
jgi:hypothetical protein